MDGEMLREYCLDKIGASEGFPFGEEVRVFKVKNKMFALLTKTMPAQISLKCEPTLAQILRNTHPAVQPGYHLNKEHWNTVTVDGSIVDEEILSMIDHSYELIAGKRKNKPPAKSDQKPSV